MEVEIDSGAVRAFALTEGPDPKLKVRAGLLPNEALLELMTALAAIGAAVVQQLTG